MERMKMTNDEKLIANVVNNGINFNMQEGTIDNLIAKEAAKKYNSELESLQADYKAHEEALAKITSEMGTDPEKLEIKPMVDHVLIKPFAHNPFQKIEMKSGIITDTGGYKANVDKNPLTGQYEEQEQVILTACVVEVGPEVKYLKVGDVVFYHKRNAMPVPFFKQGFWDLPEYAVLAVVNECLTERFANGK